MRLRQPNHLDCAANGRFVAPASCQLALRSGICRGASGRYNAQVTARRRALLIALLLSVMAVRALLPAGYMPVGGPQGLQVAMCSDGLQLLSDTRSEPADHGRLAGTGECHFSHGGAKAPPPHLLTLAALQAPMASQLTFANNEPSPAIGPPRVTTARAPPAIS
jgi:hypothetical protein